MDKEEINVASSDNSYDPDAAELLKDLDDDDDEEESFGAGIDTNLEPRNSLVNILTSSANLESLTTFPSMPPVVAELPAGEPIGKQASAADFAASQIKDEEPKDSGESKESKDSGDSEVPNDTLQDMRPAAEVKPPERAATVKLGRPFDADMPKTALEPIKSSDERLNVPDHVSEDNASLKQNDRASHPNNKRPPVPPRASMPSIAAAVPANMRLLKEGESVYTQDAIKDLMAGGRNDEAPDLAALKFADNNWYAQVFNEDYFRTIPKSAPRQTLREAKFIIDRLGVQSGARVLDLCCGYGRHTLELAKRGFDMVGLDLSMVMLKKALADAQASNQAIKFVHGDMRKLNFKSIFDAVYNVQTSFGYFDDYSNFKVLQGIYRALKPGGVFLIETVNRDFLIDDLPLRLWWKGVECMLLEEIDMDSVAGVLKVQRSFVFDGSSRAPWEQKIQIRLYSSNELRALLMRAGFDVVELSGDYSLPGAFFGASSPKIILVAEKSIKK